MSNIENDLNNEIHKLKKQIDFRLKAFRAKTKVKNIIIRNVLNEISKNFPD